MRMCAGDAGATMAFILLRARTRACTDTRRRRRRRRRANTHAKMLTHTLSKFQSPLLHLYPPSLPPSFPLPACLQHVQRQSLHSWSQPKLPLPKEVQHHVAAQKDVHELERKKESAKVNAFFPHRDTRRETSRERDQAPVDEEVHAHVLSRDAW